MRTGPIITTVVCSVICVLIGLFAVLNNYHRKINWIVFLITTVAAASLLPQGVFEYLDPTRVVLWARVDAGTTMIIDALGLYLACNFPRQLFSRKIETIYWIVSLVMIAISFTPLMIATGTSDGEVVKLTTGMLMPLYYAADTLYVLLIIPALIIQYRRGRAMDKLRVKYLLISVGGTTMILSVIGLWLPIFFQIYEAVDYIPYVILLGLALVSYDIVALRLLSIRLVVARSVAYVLLLAVVAVSYYVLALWIGQNVFKTARLTGFDQAYQVGVALTLVFLFQPVRRYFEKLTNKIFYRDHYDSQKVVNGFSNILVSERDIEPLLNHSLAILCEQLHISSGRVVIYDKGQVFAVADHNYVVKPKVEQVIAGLRQFSKNVVLSDDLTDEEIDHLAVNTVGVRASVRLVSQNEDVGILLLGDKLSGDIYSNQDVATLDIVRQELAVAVQNARAYRQLQDAQAKLQETDEMKSEFIALSSHNLRTPIATIRTISEMLNTSKSPKEISNYINMLSGVSNELSGFVEELLIISSLEAGERYESFLAVSVKDLLTPLAAKTQTECQAKGVNFELTFRSPDLYVKANTAHLQIVLRGILENAIKFTEAGSIAVTVSEQSGQCAIEVADTGVGISEEELKNLFIKFHRGTDFMRYDYTGAGVGLYLAKLVVEEHGGTITVKSRLHFGTTVTIMLPIAHGLPNKA